MVLILSRNYFPDGTNGILEYQGKLICHTIELPWKDNKPKISCIPEGEYFIAKRYSKKFGWHLEVLQVSNRSLILFHPANYAVRELQGCIAPVTKLSGPGTGHMSRQSFLNLRNLTYPILNQNQNVLLIVQSKNYNS